MKLKNNIWVALSVLYMALCIVKLPILIHIDSPTIVLDESRYFVMAQQIWYEHTYTTLHFSQYPPLYPLILSPISILDNVTDRYYCTLIANIFMLTSIIFPVFLLAREYKMSNRWSLMCAALIGMMPPFFVYAFTIMAENLYFPLFAFSVYYMKKVANDNNYKNNLLAGIMISLLVYTKMIGMCLVLVYIGEKIWQRLERTD
jgi:4-amino-4-deoxy-L-arabinose transferase-like glycosyltransferase